MNYGYIKGNKDLFILISPKEIRIKIYELRLFYLIDLIKSKCKRCMD